MYSYPKRQNTLYAAFKFGQVLMSSLESARVFDSLPDTVQHIVHNHMLHQVPGLIWPQVPLVW